ncbi:hypothetical protein K4I03_0734 [Streptococcus sanguinis]|nr:hypothetical protein [Streptococcus sanguinis]
MTRREGDMTFLNLTLQSFCLITSTSWSHLGKLWTVSRSDWCTILIDSFYSDWIWLAYKLLLWREGHCASWCNGVGSLTWNSFLLTAIFESWLYCFINQN